MDKTGKESENGAKEKSKDGSGEKLKNGSGEKSKSVVNRLYQPTAASVAKRKQTIPSKPTGPVKSAFNAGTGLRSSIKRTAGTERGNKQQGIVSKEPKPTNQNPPKQKANSGSKVGEYKTETQEASPANVQVQGTEDIKPDSGVTDQQDGGDDRSRHIAKGGSSEKRDQTPDMSVITTDRGASTPTGEITTQEQLLDNWDASQIVSLDPCVSLQEKFVMPKPVFGKTSSSSNARSTVKKPLTIQKNRASVPGKKGVPSTISKMTNILSSTIVQEPEDPDSISDELLEQAHCRYIQSLYLKHMCAKAAQKTAKECDDKLIASWKLLEQERQEVLKLEEELAKANLISDIQIVLNSMEPYLVENKDSNKENKSVMDQVISAQQKLQTLITSLDHIKHNIEVKGILIEKDKRDVTAEQIINKIQHFTRGIKSGKLVSSEMEDGVQMLQRYKEEAQSTLVNLKQCHQLIEQCRRLATKEASLKISLSMAEEASAKNIVRPKCAEVNVDVAEIEADAENNTPAVVVVDDGPDQEEKINFTADLRSSFDGLLVESTCQQK